MSLSLKTARAGGYTGSMPGIGTMGDPGLLGFLGRAAKTVLQNAPGPIGGIARGISSVLGKKRGRPSRLPQLPSSFRVALPPTTPRLGARAAMPSIVTPVPGAGGFMQRMLPGGKTGLQVVAPATGGPPGPGYHLNKSSYFLLDGTFVPEQSRWVRNRRRNPFNPRALDRAMGRITSAKRGAAKLGRITIRKTCA